MITSFDGILRNAEIILRQRSRSQDTIDGYLGGIRQVFKFAIFQNEQVCSETFLKSYLVKRESYLRSIGVQAGQIRRLYRTIGLIHNSMYSDPSSCKNPFDFDLYKSETLANIDELKVDEQVLIHDFETYLKDRGISESCVRSYKLRTVLFLKLIHQNGCEDLQAVTAQNVIASLSDFCLRQRRSYSKNICGPKAFFTWLFEKKRLIPNLSNLFRVKAPRYYPEVKTFSDEEIDKLLQALDKSSYDDALLYTFITLIKETGLRRADALKLEVQHINWQERTIVICQSKNKKVLQLPLTDNLAAVLSWFLLHIRPTLAQHYVFVNNLRPYGVKKAREISRQFQKLKQEALGMQLNGYGFHALRRSLGTKLYENEIPNYLIAELLGHSSINSTKPYIKADGKHLQECCLPMSILGEFA